MEFLKFLNSDYNTKHEIRKWLLKKHSSVTRILQIPIAVEISCLFGESFTPVILPIESRMIPYEKSMSSKENENQSVSQQTVSSLKHFIRIAPEKAL